MMKASQIHYNHQTGIVTAEPFPAGEKFTVTEEAADVELTAGDDVKVTIDGGMSHFETLSPQPLLIRQEGETVTVRTARMPETEAAAEAKKAY